MERIAIPVVQVCFPTTWGAFSRWSDHYLFECERWHRMLRVALPN